MGYPSVSGRLHTRYSPVRRSPSEYCYFMLPLDLHVLSLSLAFILSQDQTLHTKIFFIEIFFLCSVMFRSILSNFLDSHLLFVYFFQTYCNILKNYLFFRFFNFQVFQPKADAKIMHSFYSIQIF